MLLAAFTLAIWLGLLCLPFQPWRTREWLDSECRLAGSVPADYDNQRVNDSDSSADLSAHLGDVCVLIPARDEAAHIGATIKALLQQGRNLGIVVVDDQSSDGTADIAACAPNVRVVSGQEVPAGWAGKLWALEQGRSHIDTRYTLLLDADIELQPGLIDALRDKMQREELQFVSLMPALRMTGFWEKLLLPAFVYFFKLLYPFHLSNDMRFRKLAAAAGGCILLECRALDAIGGFGALKGALIDDCTLARRVKAAGFKTWIGLTHSARSLRPYDLAAIWNMVSRSAYTQLRYSPPLLAALTLAFVLTFWLPVVMTVFASSFASCLAGIALIAMATSYVPVLRFYRLSPAWAPALPLVAALFLAMTWTSAWRYHRGGERSRWKGRIYDRSEAGRADRRGYSEAITTALPQKLSR